MTVAGQRFIRTLQQLFGGRRVADVGPARQMKSKIGVLQEEGAGRRRRSGPQKIDQRKEDAHFITKEAAIAAMLLR